ncbi:MAG: hypothetical protein A2008_00380 [Candidatus Wallbacteria bacterium GWC2_49_35]|uniref:Orotate phosphoribosyltransferase n=1 Tax=Candidatus Wallbacteria bacterium GWC2_49_35 TaxID=1817813 RepID=A0A1F7WJB7_9BACT|nr:MAG: hypothetical protein A2008_00380 [Candidatus Wallbacteria bacterium GWC2_49_35]HBC74764.1 hypothetical protein [Candidatus Wallbacteria bacterium]
MKKVNTAVEKFILKLSEINAVKFGKFTLKSGIISPFYIDLRDIVSYPEIVEMAVMLLIDKIKGLGFEVLTGIPYTALPLSAVISQKLNIPLIYIRKEEKSYGTAKNVIGRIAKNSKCLVIDDVITTGESKIETIDQLESEGVGVSDIVVIVDRSHDGAKYLAGKGYNLHSVVTAVEMAEVLFSHGKIGSELKNEVENFIKNMNTEGEDKAESAPVANKMTRDLLETIERKETNLVLSLDVENQKDFFEILDRTAPHIAMLKTHVDIISDYDADFPERLRERSEKYRFMVLEDRKFADIGNTVRMQYRGGIYKISGWSDFVTVHMIAGESILNGLFDGINDKSSFLLAAMSSKENLINQAYTRRVIDIGRANPSSVSGFIGFGENAEKISKLKKKIPAGFLLLMPGVGLEKGGDTLGQTYVPAGEAVRGGADMIIVGRGIYKSGDYSKNAGEYRSAAWNGYIDRIKNQCK